jgi:hypothetical protein
MGVPLGAADEVCGSGRACWAGGVLVGSLPSPWNEGFGRHDGPVEDAAELHAVSSSAIAASAPAARLRAVVTAGTRPVCLLKLCGAPLA